MTRCTFCGRRVWPWQRQGFLTYPNRKARWHYWCYVEAQDRG